MLAVHIAQLDAGVPTLLLGHLTLPQLHHDIQRTDVVAHIVGEVRTDTKGSTDTPLAVVCYLDGTLGVKTI